MICPNCQLKNPEGAQFCSNCGTRLVHPQAHQQTTGAPYRASLGEILRKWWWVDGLAALFLIGVIIITHIMTPAATPASIAATPIPTETSSPIPTNTPLPTTTAAPSATVAPIAATPTNTLVPPTVVIQPPSTQLDGSSLLQDRCSVCHTVQRATNFSGNAAQWKNMVDYMIRRGAQLSADEEQTLINYLAKTYPQ